MLLAVTLEPLIRARAPVGELILGFLYASVTIVASFATYMVVRRMRDYGTEQALLAGLLRDVASSQDPSDARGAICESLRRVSGASVVGVYEMAADGSLVPTASVPARELPGARPQDRPDGRGEGACPG
jgi:hypothetical protein